MEGAGTRMLTKESEPEPGFQQETDLMGFASSEAPPGCLGGTGLGEGGCLFREGESLVPVSREGCGWSKLGLCPGAERKAG